VNFIGYSEDVKYYQLIQTHSNETIIRIVVKFDENILAYEPNSVFVPSSTFVSYSLPKYLGSILVYSSDDDNEDENPPPLDHLFLDDYTEQEPTPTPPLLRWVRSTQEAIGDLVGDPSYHR
jgi:hypothetical protein